MPSGKVKFWNGAKNFGFIVPDDGGPDMFVHRSALPDGIEDLVQGEEVDFEVGKDRAGRPCAEKIIAG